ncbi:hypothetical protein ABH911_005071 [Pseudomonas protegens]
MALIGFALGEALLHFDWFEGQAYLAGGLPGSILPTAIPDQK